MRWKGFKRGHESRQEGDQERDFILSQAMSFHAQEAYKALRTNVMFSIPGSKCKVIAVTSAFAGEGKSTTCVNLALTFAQTQSKILLIDLDLRKPTVHKKLTLSNEQGLTHLLNDFCTLEEGIQKTQYEQLHVITTGQLPPNPTELLASESMVNLMEQLKAQYDYIFLDTPPVNVVTDATVLAPILSGTILVVRQGKSFHKEVQSALGKFEFAKMKVLGFVLHDVKEDRKSKRYYKKYNYFGHAEYKVQEVGVYDTPIEGT